MSRQWRCSRAAAVGVLAGGIALGGVAPAWAGAVPAAVPSSVPASVVASVAGDPAGPPAQQLSPEPAAAAVEEAWKAMYERARDGESRTRG
ncbi:hypothetical protein [Streptomyces lavendulocolor]|uniref:hypothetical protein n=1 Tax=Streptomyces lavendulocolor TaxID=67316 RepID=UPI003C2E5CC6